MFLIEAGQATFHLDGAEFVGEPGQLVIVPANSAHGLAEAMVTVWALRDRRTENFPGDHGANAPNAGLANSPLSLVGCANALATLGAEGEDRTHDTTIFSRVLYH